jgi:D-arginine dehydrogenase
MSNKYDIIIVGSGIAGIGVAAALSPGRKVLILEQEERHGYHSTGRSAAIFIQNYGNATIRALSAASARLFSKGDARWFSHPLLTRRGMLSVASQDGLEDHRALLDESQDLVVLTLDEAIAMVPALRRDWLAAAAYEAGAQDIDVSALHEGWLRRAKANGAHLSVNTALLNARRQGGQWLVQTDSGEVSAPVLVNAAGAWADDVARRAGVATIGLQPMRRTIGVLPAPDGCDISAWPLIADSAEGWYAKPDAGKLYVSPADETPVEPHDAWVDDMSLAEGLYRFEQAMDIPVTRVERSWAGLRTFAPDRTPVAGFDPSADGFFWLAGQGGYGIQTSPALSALAAALVQGHEPTAGLEAAAKALSPARFRDTH